MRRTCSAAFWKPVRTGHEFGSGWLTQGLRQAGIAAVCTCARQAHGVLKGKPHKTDRNDALMLARMAHANLLSPVYVRSANAHQRKALVVIRGRLVSIRNALTNAIRGHLKPFGLKLGRVRAAAFDHRVRELSEAHPLLRLALAREDAVCQLFMSIPSIGALAAVTYTHVIDDPHHFAQSSQIANYLGLTPRRYQSGETDCSGRISKTGDTALRHLLYECANNMIAILKKDCALKRWAIQLQARIGARKARTALARKLAVLMHRLWIKGETFNWNAGMPA